MKLLSIIVPCFNEQESIPIFYSEVMKVSQKLKDSLDVEIVFVNDGSSDIIELEVEAGNTYEISAETAAVAANMTVTPSFT